MEYNPNKEFEKELFKALNEWREENNMDWFGADLWTLEQRKAEKAFIAEYTKQHAPAGYKQFSFDED